MTLDDLHQQVTTCHRCPEIEHCVGGYGPKTAELFVVGQSLHSYNHETPDRQIPFIGPTRRLDSGVLLYETLEQAGYSYKRNNIFVTNVVKGHPPHNRVSRADEIEACRAFLNKELEIVQPTLILTLGTDAREWFRLPRPGNGKYADWHLRRSNKQTVGFVMAAHPSYILRYGSHYKHVYSEHVITSLQVCCAELKKATTKI